VEFIIALLGRIPRSTEERSMEYENLVFKIEELKEKRIEKIKVYIKRET
jgi:putative hemolysin